jgi:hypothetical protein
MAVVTEKPTACNRQVYPIGVPSAYFALLYRIRHRLNPPGLTVKQIIQARARDAEISRLSFLYKTYRTDAW